MNYFDEILYLSRRLLKYESVYGHGGIDQGAVFGHTILNCHKEVLDYCRNLGLKTYLDPEGMYAYAETHEGEDYIAILTHLDVVASGDLCHWDYPPFEASLVDDKLIARGAADDKVPAAIGVLAIKRLMDEGVKLKYPIRIIFGGDEETGFRCIKKYKQVHKSPKYTLVMDGTFPFSYSEKHLLNYELHTSQQIKLEGGVGYNSVMDHVTWYNGDLHIEERGQSAHASRPTQGENALIKLAYMNQEHHDFFKLVNRLVGPDGSHKLSFLEDEKHFKETSLCLGKVKDGVLYTDLRVPPEMDLEAFKISFENLVKTYGIKPVLTDSLRGTITCKESKFAKTVLMAYQEVTGDLNSMPFKTGSATYGRSFDENCLSFGPRMPYHITNTHKANEFVPFDLIKNAFEIYVHTLKMIEEGL